ncbi:flavin reductase family protein [Sphingomonas aracearum]|uniref:Flavin reductase family protein n=1 Tax=Sphingomonas aracearum TaxID=2283317 RepID=A0A369W083_9SPHN|nr:flavin reductase family protein [Sphingomonas aracearum]RDE07295.1 flavin reductase family protein [Sphingomonas aracearum]
MHFYEPRHGHRLPHDPLNAIVAPRPIGWISTLSAACTRNLAPYSFFSLFSYTPPIVGFSSLGWKHSVANIAETGEFVWNLVTRDLAEPMNATATMRAVDEFAAANLEAAPSTLVAPPRVAAARAAFECRLSQMVQLTDASGTELPQWLVLGEVIGIHLDEELLENGVFQTARARPVTRGGGPADYFEITADALFRMRRPA